MSLAERYTLVYDYLSNSARTQWLDDAVEVWGVFQTSETLGRNQNSKMSILIHLNQRVTHRL